MGFFMYMLNKHSCELNENEIAQSSYILVRGKLAINMALCIIGDIGGTNARFQLLEVHDAHSEILHQNVHPSKSYKNVYECLKAFMATAPIGQNQVKLAVLACAGLVHGNSCQVNNAGWPDRTTAEKVQQETGVEKVIFINDLVAVG